MRVDIGNDVERVFLVYDVHNEGVIIIDVDDVVLNRATYVASVSKEMAERDDTAVLEVDLVYVGSWKIFAERATVSNRLVIERLGALAVGPWHSLDVPSETRT